MAIIDLSRNRDEFFTQTKMSRVRKEVGEIPIQIDRLEDLEGLIENGVIVPATSMKTTDHGTLRAMREPEPNAQRELEVAKHLKDKQVMLINPQLRLPQRESRRKRNYSNFSYINLMGSAIKRRVMNSQEVPDGPLPDYVVAQGNNTQKLLSLGVEMLQQSSLGSHRIMGYRWEKEFVPWTSLVFGTVARAHQNAVYWSRFPTQALELKKGANKKQRARIDEKVAHCLHMRQRYGITQEISDALAQLKDDLIEEESTPHFQPRRGLRPPMVGHWRMKTLSVRGGKQHSVKIGNVAAVPEDEETAAGMTFGIRRETSIPSEHWFGERNYWSGQSIAAVFAIAKIVSKREVVKAYQPLPNQDFGRHIYVPLTLPDLPFLIPTSELIRRVHTLQYRTVIPEKVDERWRLRTLNTAEIDQHLGLFTVQRGVDALWKGYAAAQEERLDTQKYAVEYKGI